MNQATLQLICVECMIVEYDLLMLDASRPREISVYLERCCTKDAKVLVCYYKGILTF